jgi:hypothetical protein
VITNNRTEYNATLTELSTLARTLTSITGTFLFERFCRSQSNFGTAFGLVGAGLQAGQLPINNPV